MNFISPGSKPADLPPAENTGGGDMSSSLMKISENVNIIRGIVESGEKLEKDKMDDTREAREKKKRSMAENLMEGTKGAVKAVTGALGKVLSPVKGIFMQIFDFLTKFLLGAGNSSSSTVFTLCTGSGDEATILDLILPVCCGTATG